MNKLDKLIEDYDITYLSISKHGYSDYLVNYSIGEDPKIYGTLTLGSKSFTPLINQLEAELVDNFSTEEQRIEHHNGQAYMFEVPKTCQ